MELYKQSCRNCGGDLYLLDDQSYKCRYCGSVYTKEATEKHVDSLRSLFDEIKLEAVSNARRNLYDAVNAEYISNTHVHECCMAIKQLIPDDFQAFFYETAITNNNRKLSKLIRKIDVADNFDRVESMIRFLILSLQSDFILETADLIERAYKTSDLTKYEKYSTMLSEEAEKLENCIYLTSFPRDVFVAYSSKDMDKVFELVECLEEQGFSCFVAARNLRHGRGAVENYDQALREAMDSCSSFVLVSSSNSRHPSCDALRKEIPYIRSVDVANAPADLRNDYTSIPHKFKKHRVEYRIEESLRAAAADRMVSEFFDGYERVYSPDEVADRILNRPAELETTIASPEPQTTSSAEAKAVKYCIMCEHECDEASKFCPECGGNKFASTLSEAALMREIEKLKADKNESVAQIVEPVVSKATEEAVKPAAPEQKTAKEPVLTPFKQPANTVRAASNVEMYNSLHIDPKTVEHIAVPEGTSSLVANCFVNCKKLISVSLPDGLEDIGYDAFLNCSNLQHIIIPDTVKSIGNMAFRGCSNIDVINLPRDLESLGENAFSEMPKLVDVLVHKDNTHFKKIDNALFSADGKILYKYLPRVGKTEYTIPDGVEVVRSGAFSANLFLKKINIPSSVTTLKNEAFVTCWGLEEIEIPSTVKNLGTKLFGNCDSLKKVTLPEGISSVPESTFERCSALESVVIPDSVDTICASAFIECKALKEITLSPNIKTIGEYAFASSGLSSIILPGSLNSIGNNGFAYSALTSITLPKNLTMIGTQVFKGCTSLKSVTVNGSVAGVGTNAFEGCTALESVTLGNNGSLAITASAFENCRSLRTVELSSILHSIGNRAFANCTSLESIRIPEFTKAISGEAFEGCSALRSVAFENPNGWKKEKGLFSGISPKLLSDPYKAAEALTVTFVSERLERK